MSVQENKALAHRPHEEVFNQGKLELADQIYAPDFAWHSPGIPPNLPRGPEGVKQFVTVVRAAFPDLHLTVEESLGEGDKVVNRWVFRGTHQGEFAGIPPTGKQVTLTGIDIWRISGGKLVELRQELDFLGLLQQLGAVPVTERARA
jgi:steroid delta-isomerase-like uncharacterized protein